jgi:glucosamine 6-phosphate synthetase-like amidotransferase/phosphosugar isomerase protein
MNAYEARFFFFDPPSVDHSTVELFEANSHTEAANVARIMAKSRWASHHNVCISNGEPEYVPQKKR